MSVLAGVSPVAQSVGYVGMHAWIVGFAYADGLSAWRAFGQNNDSDDVALCSPDVYSHATMEPQVNPT